MEKSMVFTAVIICIIAAVLFLAIRPDLGVQEKAAGSGKDTSSIQGEDLTKDSGERSGSDYYISEDQKQEDDRTNSSGQTSAGNGSAGGISGTPLIPTGPSGGPSAPSADTQTGNSGGSSEWNVPDPFVPDPSVVLFTTPPQPLDDVTIYAFDIGNDAFFIDTPADDVLVDAGRVADGNAVIAMLEQMNKTRIEIVLASHHADDHMGGLISVLDKTNVTWVMDSGSQGWGQVYVDYMSRAQLRNFTIVRAGDVFQIAPNITMEIIHPSIYYPLSMEKDNSIVFRLAYREFKMLFTGDCRRQCETDIFASGKDISADILKVGDHASINSTSQQFLEAVNATSAIISLGPELAASYKVPNADVLARMSSRGMMIYRTDQNGNIAITTNGVSYQVLTEK
jgi:competence protein ComEC